MSLSNIVSNLMCQCLISEPVGQPVNLMICPMLNKRLSKKMQSAQNKCIRFYLNLKNTTHVGATEFKAINWLPTKNRVDQDTCVNIMKFFKAYADEMFQSADQS